MKKFIFSIVAALTLSMAVPQSASAGRIVWNGKTVAKWNDKDVDWYPIFLDLFLSQWEWGMHEDEWAGCDGCC